MNKATAPEPSGSLGQTNESMNDSNNWGLNRLKNLFRGKKPEKISIKTDVETDVGKDVETTEDRRIFSEDLRTKDNMNERFHDLPRSEGSNKRNILSNIGDRQLQIDSNLDKVVQNNTSNEN